MSKFEGTQDLNNVEVSQEGVGESVSSEKLEKNEIINENGVEKEELSQKEQIEELEKENETHSYEIEMLTKSIEETKSKINEVRGSLGLPPTEEDSPSIFAKKEKLEKLQTEKEDIDKQKEEIITQQEKEQLIKEEKEKIIQEKLDELFKEFKELSSGDLENIARVGKTSKGNNVESKAIGSIEPEIARTLAKAFKEGVKLLPKIFEMLPEFLEKLEEDLSKEATERVERKLEDQKLKMDEEKENEDIAEKPEELRNSEDIDDTSVEQNTEDSRDVENNK